MANSEKVINIKSTDTSNAFADKCKVLGISKERQVEILNKKYAGQLLFGMDEGYVTLLHILTPVSILELPAVEELKIRLTAVKNDKNLDIKYGEQEIFKQELVAYNRAIEILSHLTTVKLPPTMTDVTNLWFDRAYNIEALWLWDNSNVMEIYRNNDNTFGKDGHALVRTALHLNRVIIQHVDGRRPDLVKIHNMNTQYFR